MAFICVIKCGNGEFGSGVNEFELLVGSSDQKRSSGMIQTFSTFR